MSSLPDDVCVEVEDPLATMVTAASSAAGEQRRRRLRLADGEELRRIVGLRFEVIGLLLAERA